MWQPNERYPDPSVRVLDPSFNQYRLMLASDTTHPASRFVYAMSYRRDS